MRRSLVDPDRLFPVEPNVRAIARRLYAAVEKLPIISPHGHTEARWYAEDKAFPNPAQLLIVPDHYICRMLYSQGVPLEALGIARLDGAPSETDGRAIWRRFAAGYHLFRGTPTRLWLDHTLQTLFGMEERPSAENADEQYDAISEVLARPEFRPRVLYERFNIEAIATTNSPLEDLRWHDAIRKSGWKGKVTTAYRPDEVIDPDFPGFARNIERLGEIAGEDTSSWRGYLAAHRRRREFFKAFGGTSTDHGHPSARTADLGAVEAEALFHRVVSGRSTPEDAELFRAQMLTEMARMSLDDGLVMQIHPGSFRNHNAALFAAFGRDVGGDIPTPTDFVRGLKPLLDRFGNEPELSVVLFTLDESTYGRELAPLAGHYPVLRLGPPWWFFDSVEGMRRFRQTVTETAGFANTVGFNDDTRAFLSIPARHDMARRVDCAYLAELVATHQLDEEEAGVVAHDLAYAIAKRVYQM